MERIVTSAIQGYLKLFIKNYKTDSLSISLLKGEGSLNNIDLNEAIFSELIPIPFLVVQRCHVTKLSVKLPSITRLTNDPVVVYLDKMMLEMEEPIIPKPYETPLQDFLRGSSTSKKSSSSTPQLKQYGFVDRLIDGVRIRVNTVDVWIKTLGKTPSQTLGEWTPPYLHISLESIELNTTNDRWEYKGIDLKNIVPQTITKPDISIFKLANLDRLNVELVHPLLLQQNRAPSSPATSVRNNGDTSWQPMVIPLISDLSAQVKILIKRKSLGLAFEHINLELLIQKKVSIKLEQNEISTLIRFLLGLSSAAQRKDLIAARMQAVEKKKAQQPSPQPTGTPSASSSTSVQTNKSGSSSSLKTSGGSSLKRSAAMSKFINTTQQNEEDLSDEEDFEDVDPADEVFALASGKQAENSGARIVFKFMIDELYISIINDGLKSEIDGKKKPQDASNPMIGYMFELLGFNFSIVKSEKPEESDQVNLNIAVPFFQFKELLKLDPLLYKTKKSKHEGHAHQSDDDDDRFIIRPRLKLVDEDVFVVSSEAGSTSRYTIDMSVFPEFLSTHRGYPIFTKDEYPNLDTSIDWQKRKYFQVGKEVMRFKFSSNITSFWLFESRINPIELRFDIIKLKRLVEYVLASLPDLTVEPPNDNKIIYVPRISVLPPSSEAKKEKIETPKEDDEDMKEFSFLVEIRKPSILFPANYKANENGDKHDEGDVTEQLRISAKEIIVTADPRLKRQAFTQKDSLYRLQGDTFPARETDFTSFNNTMWESMPTKLKLQFANFEVELLPSMNAPPQRIMEPLSLNIDVGVNDYELSSHHKKLPKFVIISQVEKLDFRLTQNQAILLLEFVKSYVDDPPELSSFVIQHTRKFADANKQALGSDISKVLQKGFDVLDRTAQKTSTAQVPEQPKPVAKPAAQASSLIQLFFLIRLEKLSVTLSKSTRNIAEMFDPELVGMGMEPLVQLDITGTELLVETHESQKLVVGKSRMDNIFIHSPVKGQQPAAVILAHKSAASPYIFHGKQGVPSSVLHHMVELRYEQPVSRDIPVNGVLKVNANGLHLGLSVDTAFQIVKFVTSKENIFDCSPYEILNRTVKRTYNFIRERYLPKKKKKGKKNIFERALGGKEEEDIAHELLAPTALPTSQVSDNDAQEATEIEQEVAEEIQILQSTEQATPVDKIEDASQERATAQSLEPPAASEETNNEAKTTIGTSSESATENSALSTPLPPIPQPRKIPTFPSGVFLIRLKSLSDLYMDAKNQGVKSGTRIILWSKGNMAYQKQVKNQQWMFDPATQIILNVHNKLALAAKPGHGTWEIFCAVPDPGRLEHKWIWDGQGHFLSMYNPAYLLDVRSAPKRGVEVAARSIGSASQYQEWELMSPDGRLYDPIAERLVNIVQVKAVKPQKLPPPPPQALIQQSTEVAPPEAVPLTSQSEELPTETSQTAVEEASAEREISDLHEQSEQEQSAQLLAENTVDSQTTTEEVQSAENNSSTAPPVSETTSAEPIPTPVKESYPLLIEAVINELELFVIDEGQQPYSLGFELRTLAISHKPEKLLRPITKTEPQEMSEEKEKKESEVVGFSNASHFFELKFIAYDAVLAAIIPDAQSTSPLYPKLSDPISAEFGLVSDYSKPLTQRTIFANILTESKSESLQLEKTVTKLLRMDPSQLYSVSKLVRSQFNKLKVWLDNIYNFVARVVLVVRNETSQHLESITAKLTESQTAVTKALIDHYVLCQYIAEQDQELREKEIALASAINDKMRTMEMLANMQSQAYSQASTPSSPLQKPAEPTATIIMDGTLNIMTPSIEKWRRCYAVLSSKGELLFLAQQIKPPQLFSDSPQDQALVQKNLIFVLKMSEKTITFMIPLPFENEKEPRPVFAVNNDEKNQVYIFTPAEKEMKDWIRLVEATVADIKQRKAKVDQEIQTDPVEGEVSTPLEAKPEKTAEEKLEDMGNLADNKIIAAAQKITEMKNMERMFNNVRDCLKAAKSSEQIVEQKVDTLYKYVKQLQKEEASKLDNIQEQLKKEAKRVREIEKEKETNKKLLIALEQQKKVEEKLRSEISKEQEKAARQQEENKMLLDVLRQHIAMMGEEMQKMKKEKQRMANELQTYQKKYDSSQQKAIKLQTGSKSEQIVNKSIMESEIRNNNLRTLLNDAYEQLARKEAEIDALKSENIQLRSSSVATGSLPPPPTTSTPPKKALPPVPPHTTHQQVQTEDDPSVLITDSSDVSTSSSENTTTTTLPPVPHKTLPPLPPRKLSVSVNFKEQLASFGEALKKDINTLKEDSSKIGSSLNANFSALKEKLKK